MLDETPSPTTKTRLYVCENRDAAMLAGTGAVQPCWKDRCDGLLQPLAFDQAVMVPCDWPTWVGPCHLRVLVTARWWGELTLPDLRCAGHAGAQRRLDAPGP